jgi:hypothetical protein
MWVARRGRTGKSLLLAWTDEFAIADERRTRAVPQAQAFSRSPPSTRTTVFGVVMHANGPDLPLSVETGLLVLGVGLLVFGLVVADLYRTRWRAG